ncbi:MAG: hypothetical protein ACE5FV_11715 [Woeseia sp.]
MVHDRAGAGDTGRLQIVQSKKGAKAVFGDDDPETPGGTPRASS